MKLHLLIAGALTCACLASVPLRACDRHAPSAAVESGSGKVGKPGRLKLVANEKPSCGVAVGKDRWKPLSAKCG